MRELDWGLYDSNRAQGCVKASFNVRRALPQQSKANMLNAAEPTRPQTSYQMIWDFYGVYLRMIWVFIRWLPETCTMAQMMSSPYRDPTVWVLDES